MWPPAATTRRPLTAAKAWERSSASKTMLAALTEIQYPLSAAVAVIFKDQTLHAQLDPLRVVCASGNMRPAPPLVVDRHHRPILNLDQIKLRDQAEPVGGQRHGTGVNALVFADCGGLGQLAGAAIDTSMCTEIPPVIDFRTLSIPTGFVVHVLGLKSGAEPAHLPPFRVRTASAIAVVGGFRTFGVGCGFASGHRQ